MEGRRRRREMKGQESRYKEARLRNDLARILVVTAMNRGPILS
jgi:hypothetical protein